MEEQNKNMSNRIIPFLSGALMSVNFVILWAIPVAGMGSAYKFCVKPVLKPIYNFIDTNPLLRKFATDHIYTKPEHADFFAMSLLLVLNSIISIGVMFYWQLSTGKLPFWLIFCYYCSWVGIGGSMMGTAYGMAHKEAHHHGLYKKWIRTNIGHFFENSLGVFYGNVPWNFTTSHIFVHHKLDGGIGDSFYMWDFDRSSLAEFMPYVHRIFLHMLGISSIKFLASHSLKSKADLLQKGVQYYWITALVIFAITRSPSFLFWFYLEPLLCMTYFLALINVGFHGFIEFDDQGHSLPMVNSSTIIDGEDDFFGEDDHMAHHYNTSVYYRDLPAHQASKKEDFVRNKASVFKQLSIVELSIFIILGLWDKLADHYVDYSGKMSREEIKHMLKTRAQRLETTYDRYEQYLTTPSVEARKAYMQEITVNAALSVQREKECSSGGVGSSGKHSPVDRNIPLVPSQLPQMIEKGKSC